MAEEKTTEKKPAAKAAGAAEEPLTPSAIALAEVGVPADGLEPEAALAHGEAYQAAKRKARWG